MDLRLCEFIEHAWEEGDSRDIPADARSGLTHVIDAPRRHLLAVSDCYWHGAKMSCQSEQILCG